MRFLLAVATTIVAVAFVLVWSDAPAAAQVPRRPVLTGNPVADIKAATANAPVPLTGDLRKDAKALADKLSALELLDLEYASAKANIAGTTQSKVRKQCVDSMIVTKKLIDGTDVVGPDGKVLSKPDPGFITGVETVAEVIDALAPTGDLFTNCAGAAQLAKTSTLTVINAIITGAASFTTIAPIIP